MAEFKLIYDDGYGVKSERTITSFTNPREKYLDLGDDPTWPALLKECWEFVKGLGFVISKSEQDCVNDYLEIGPQIDDEECSACCGGNCEHCEHCQCEETTDEPADESFDGKCAKCPLNDTCEELDSENCPMNDDECPAELEDECSNFKKTSKIEDMIMDCLDEDTRNDLVKKLMGK